MKCHLFQRHHNYAEGNLSVDVYSSHRDINAVDIHVAWNDPVNFVEKRVDSTLINLLIDKPHQPDENYTFPKTNERSFLHAWFRNTLPDGTTVNRRWLSWHAVHTRTSVTASTAYCLARQQQTNCGLPQASMVGNRVTVNVAYCRTRLQISIDNQKLHIFIGQQI